MKFKWIVNTLVIILILTVAILGLVQRDAAVAAEKGSDKIEGLLLDQLAADGSADFIVRFSEQADLSSAYYMDWDARGEFVYNTLRDTAERTQANAKSILDERGLTYQTFIAGNDLYVWGGNQVAVNGLAVLNELAALPEVYFIRASRTYYIDPMLEDKPFDNISWAGDLLANNVLTKVNSTNATIAWGITDTKADQAWQLGARGAGIKVANIDTGVQWNHPALVNQFACPGDPSNPDCWADPKNICGGSACDNNGHGTHTMGTMAAKDSPSLPYIAGMAPDATWIACKGCESSSCSDVALNACADWILAPGGDANNRPNVVNNSWGGTPDGDTWYLSKVNAWLAAGIFPAFSAGNDGSGCDTMGDPGSYQESFASGAHDSGREIAYFSSRGPSAFGHEPYTKPNISAPGVNICSTIPGSGWSCGYSGTSMASPHTAGAVAQLWSCAPQLVGQIDATFKALQSSADVAPGGNCDTPPDNQGNYTYGYGYLDVLNMVNLNCDVANVGTLEGHVYDQNGNPAGNATITAQPAIEGNFTTVTTDPSGFYTMKLSAGTYNVTASKSNYDPQTVNGVEVLSGKATTQDFKINFLGGWMQIELPDGCPDLTRLDAEYYDPTDKAYILGGRGGTTGADTIGDIFAFDPVARNCTDTNTNMLTPISNYTIVPLNDGNADLLCTFGGRNASGTMIQTVQCYNPVANSVVTKADLPSAFSNYLPGGVAVVNNKAYIFGGFRPNASPYSINVTYEYDPIADSYIAKGNLALGRGYIDMAVVDGKIYAFGGDIYDGTNLVAQTKTEVFNPVTGTWDDMAVAELPTASGEGRAYGFEADSGYEFASKIVIAGGGQWPNESYEIFVYDIASNTYDYSLPDLNVARRNHAGFFVPGDSGAMWVFGGRTGGVETPPYAPPEYYTGEHQKSKIFLPIINK